MTPKEKAKQLLDRFYDCPNVQETQSKRCALIAIDLLFDTCESLNVRYWQEVKLEIQKP